MDIVRNSGKKDFQSFAEFFQIIVQQTCGKLRHETHSDSLGFRGVTVQDVGTESCGDLLIGKVKKIPGLPEFLFRAFNGKIPRLQQQCQRIDIVDFKGAEGDLRN